MTPTTAALIILTVLVLLTLAGGAGLLRRVRQLESVVLDGVGMTLAASAADSAVAVAVPGSMTLVAKVDSRCSTCAEVVDAIATRGLELPDGLGISIVTDDKDFARAMPPSVTVFSDEATYRAIKTAYTPALLVVDESGMVVYNTPATSGRAVDDLINQMLSRKEKVS